MTAVVQRGWEVTVTAHAIHPPITTRQSMSPRRVWGTATSDAPCTRITCIAVCLYVPADFLPQSGVRTCTRERARGRWVSHPPPLDGHARTPFQRPLEHGAK
ncbi:hypothetical protein EON67_07135 [archaeon]|nr:MAG: hypothetical protein EON67_07135 [archaeon]